MGPSNSTLRYISKRMKTYSHKTLYTNVHGIIHNSQTVETTQKSINRQMDKQNVIYPYKGILLSHKKKQSPHTCYNMDEIWQH